jgi:hypothetical protein
MDLTTLMALILKFIWGHFRRPDPDPDPIKRAGSNVIRSDLEQDPQHCTVHYTIDIDNFNRKTPRGKRFKEARDIYNNYY